MEKKNIDWANIGFGYMPTDYRFVANYKDGAWDEGGLTEDPNIVMMPTSQSLNVPVYYSTLRHVLKE